MITKRRDKTRFTSWYLQGVKASDDFPFYPLPDNYTDRQLLKLVDHILEEGIHGDLNGGIVMSAFLWSRDRANGPMFWGRISTDRVVTPELYDIARSWEAQLR